MKAKRIEYFIIVLNLILVIVLTVLIVLFMNGRLEIPFAGNKSLHGLINIDSVPSRAQIYLDGKLTKFTTPSDLSFVSVGKHHIRISRDGYQDWEKDVDILPGEIERLDYITLIPKTLKKTLLIDNDLDLISSKLQLYQESPNQFLIINEFGLSLIKNAAIVPLISIEEINNKLFPEDKKVNKIEDYIISPDKKNLILKASLDNSINWLVISNFLDNPQFQNISRDYSLNIAEINWANNEQLYVLDDLMKFRLISIGQKSITANLNDAIVNVFVFNQRIFLIKKENNQTINLYQYTDSKFTLIFSNLPTSNQYQVVFLKDQSDKLLQLAIYAKESKNLNLYSQTESGQNILTLSNDVAALMLPKRQFENVFWDENNGTKHSYNLISKEFYSSAGGGQSNIFDNDHLINFIDQKVTLSDFDFTNEGKLAEIKPSDVLVIPKERNDENCLLLLKENKALFLLEIQPQ